MATCEADLIERAVHGDQEAFRQLWEAHHAAAMAAALRLCHQRALAGIDVFGLSSRYFVDLAETLRQGAAFPTLIFVAQSEASPLVVLEGHARLTAYLIAPECLPRELEVIVGFSEQITQWGCY